MLQLDHNSRTAVVVAVSDEITACFLSVLSVVQQFKA